MVLLTRLAKQVYRRSSEELLGMHLRHLMALSYLRDHDGAPQQELAEVALHGRQQRRAAAQRARGPRATSPAVATRSTAGATWSS